MSNEPEDVPEWTDEPASDEMLDPVILERIRIRKETDEREPERHPAAR
jgi:hypothetical protein